MNCWYVHFYLTPGPPADRRTPYSTYFSPPLTPYTVTSRTPWLIVAGPQAVGGGNPPPPQPHLHTNVCGSEVANACF